MVDPSEHTTSAEVVIGCDELEPSLEFYQRLGFALELISPADAPTTAVVRGHGLGLRLVVDRGGGPSDTGSGGRSVDAGGSVRLRLTAERSVVDELGPTVVGPEGTVVDIVARRDEPVLPPAAPRFELSRFDPAAFGTGRASMAYRDLLPSRQGGRYIASHILIANGGPVPDYVHHHAIVFQLIYCRRGWVRVVYEDQGPPFVLEPGDCVLQPPGIRHQVLDASDGLEVVEVSCPAVHDTRTDPDLVLPTASVAPDRRFGGQWFVRHVAARAEPVVDGRGFAVRDVGLTAATGGVVTLRAISVGGGQVDPIRSPDSADLHLLFVESGHATVTGPGSPSEPLGSADAVALPAGGGQVIDDFSPEFEALELVVRHTPTS